MSYDAALTALRERNTTELVKLFVDQTQKSIQPSFRVENDLWDYKLVLPVLKSSSLVWAELSKDILAFHNTRKEGIIVFGVDDTALEIVGVKVPVEIDSKIVNDKIRKYLGDQLWVELHSPIRVGDYSLAFLLIPGLSGSVKRFISNAPEKDKKPLFCNDGSAIRKGDSSYILNVEEANVFSVTNDTLSYGMYKINGPDYQILNPDYIEFIRREKYCSLIQNGLERRRVSAVTLTGIGGIGKTSLAIWATEQAYLSKKYDHIISMSAKDRELTAAGIEAIHQGFTTIEDILNNILSVIGFDEYISETLANKEKYVRQLLQDSNTLILLDNLETTADTRIEDFLNDLPEGVKAIVTSRRNIVRVSSYPIEVEGLEDEEIVRYMTSLCGAFDACAKLSRSEKLYIGEACNRIPLAIKWLVSRCKTTQELLAFAGQMESSTSSTSQLLEFVFRRLFERMNSAERRIVQVLSIASDIPDEALIQGCFGIEENIWDSLEILVRDTIVIKKFDDKLNWYKYSLLPLTKAFILKNCTTPQEDERIRRRLRAWFQAEDIKNEQERVLIQNMRQNGKNVGDALITMAFNAQSRGAYENAVQLYEQAIMRDPHNWRVYRAYAEYFRNYEKNTSLAIQNYKKALEYLPKNDIGYHSAVIRREYAMLYMRSGQPDAMNVAITELEKAHTMYPSDPIAARFLAEAYITKGFYEKTIEVLSIFVDTKDEKTQKNIWPILLNAYEKIPNKYVLEQLKMKEKMRKANL